MGPLTSHFVLPRTLQAAGQGRRLLAVALDRVSPDLLSNIMLVLTELVTNSVRHGSSPPDAGVEVEVRVDQRSLFLTVCDPGPGLDPAIIPEPRDEGGWGLVLVDKLATRWGVTTNDHTCVWTEFDLMAS